MRWAEVVYQSPGSCDSAEEAGQKPAVQPITGFQQPLLLCPHLRAAAPLSFTQTLAVCNLQKRRSRDARPTGERTAGLSLIHKLLITPHILLCIQLHRHSAKAGFRLNTSYQLCWILILNSAGDLAFASREGRALRSKMASRRAGSCCRSCCRLCMSS